MDGKKLKLSRLFSWVIVSTSSALTVAFSAAVTFSALHVDNDDIDIQIDLKDIEPSTLEELLAVDPTIVDSFTPVLMPLPEHVLKIAEQMRVSYPEYTAIIHGHSDDRQAFFSRGFFNGTGQLKKDDNVSLCTVTAIEIPGYKLQQAGTLFSTSAHCFDDDKSFKDQYHISIQYAEGKQWEHEILADEHVWVHPLYQETKPDNDIAFIYIPHVAPSAIHRLPVDMTYGVEVYAEEPIGSAVSAGFPFDMKGEFVAQDDITIWRDFGGLSFQSDYDTVAGSSGGALIPEVEGAAHIVAVTTGGFKLEGNLLYSLHASFMSVAPYLNDIPFLYANESDKHPFFTHRISGDYVRARLGATIEAEVVGVWDEGTCVHVFEQVAGEDGYQWGMIAHANGAKEFDGEHVGQMSVFTAIDFLEPLDDPRDCGPRNSNI